MNSYKSFKIKLGQVLCLFLRRKVREDLFRISPAEGGGIEPARWAESSANVASWTRTSAPRPIGSTLLLSQVSPRITTRLRSTEGGGDNIGPSDPVKSVVV